MQPTTNLQYASSRTKDFVAWHRRFRFTFLGFFIGVMAGSLVGIIFFAAANYESWLGYLAPISFQIINAWAIGPTVGIGVILVAGAVGEWTVWGVLIDWFRSFLRSRRKRLPVA